MRGGEWLTQSYPTNCHSFHRRKMLVGSEKPEDFREVTDAEKAAIEAADAKWTRPPRSFVDQWNQACGIWGRYNERTGYFELNGLTDITYQQAVAIYQAGPLFDSLEMFAGGVFETIRTNLPSVRQTEVGYNSRIAVPYTGAFPGGMEVVNLNPANKEADLYVKNRATGANISHYTFNARRYIGVINLRQDTESAFIALQVTHRVEHLLIRCLHMDAMIGSARLDIESMAFLVAEATNTSPITITTDADTFAKLTDEANAEWHQVLLDAETKNITFATA